MRSSICHQRFKVSARGSTQCPFGVHDRADVSYEPPFEMPNYREVGKTLMDLIRSYSLEDDVPSNDMTFTVHPSEKDFFAQPTLPQREIGERPWVDVTVFIECFFTEDDSPFALAKPKPKVKPPPAKSVVTTKPTTRPAVQRTTPATRTITAVTSRAPPTARRPLTTSSVRLPTTTTTRKSISQPVTRAPTSQSAVRAPPSRATTRAPSVARSTPLVRTGAAQPNSRTMSIARPTTRPTTRPTPPTAPVKSKPVSQPSAIPTTRNPTPPSNVPPNTSRPRSGTITKAAFESNTHVVVHIRNSSLEDVKKDLEGLIVFEDAFDDDDGFRFDV